MEYTLHAAPGSCSLAPHIVLEEIQAQYRLALMAPGHPETKTDEFRQVNPKGRVPVLLAENFHLTEAPAILIYLGLKYPNFDLIRSEADELARVVEWCNWLSGHVHQVAVRMIWRAEYFIDDERARPALIAKGSEHLSSAFSMVETKLTATGWAVGNRYTVVDPYLLVFYRWGNLMKIDMRNKYPAWTDHAQKIASRRAVQDALTQEGISIWE